MIKYFGFFGENLGILSCNYFFKYFEINRFILRLRNLEIWGFLFKFLYYKTIIADEVKRENYCLKF